jgi:hypothetical protein
MMSVDCKTAARWIDVRAEGRLSTSDAVRLEAHLAACAACEDWAHQLDEVAQALRASRRPVAADFTDRVVARAAAERPAPHPLARPRVLAWAWLPAAAVILVALGLIMGHEISQRRVASVQPPEVAVELELADVQAHTVAVAGDFNGWDAARMTKGADGVWRVRLSLTPGRYQYAFVIDGEKWIADPHSSTVVDSGFSGSNSVLDVSL